MESLKAFAKARSESYDFPGFIEKLEESSKNSSSKGRATSRELLTFDSNHKVRSWKFKEWDYSNSKITLPTYARGLFTDEESIVVRGYNKFFNINEVRGTKLAYLQENFKGPYEVTLKTNGCIIFISGLSSGELVVCSKHSTGYREDLNGNHALEGQKLLEKQLQQQGVSKEEFGKMLYELNITAVAEYCNDEFEEHILRYSGDDAGLYLHGINFNEPKFKTFPMNLVNEFAKKFGFKETDYIIYDDFEKMMAFFEESAKTGTYKGVEVEGFVIRGKVGAEDYFWKYKFEEPYLMYREWREATKRLINSGFDLESVKTRHPATRAYLSFVLPILKSNEDLCTKYLYNHGIIALRELFLKHVGLKGYELVDVQNLDNVTDTTRLEQDVAELTEKMSKIKVNPVTEAEKPETKAEEPETIVVDKYILVPIATLGCGKTTVAKTLCNMFPAWGYVSNDDVKVTKNLKKRFERLCSEFLAGNSEIIQPENINKEVEEYLKNPKKFKQKPFEQVTDFETLSKNQVIIADRNNHMLRERKDFMMLIKKFQKSYMPEYLDAELGKTVKVKVHFIALNFLPDFYEKKDQIWEITKQRVLARGNNHQTITVDDEDHLNMVMKGFLNRFEPFNRAKLPDSKFEVVANLNIFAEDFSKKNCTTVLQVLNKNVPGLAAPVMPLDDAYAKALAYKPIVRKVVKSRDDKSGKKSTSTPKPKPKPKSKFAYFGISVDSRILQYVKEVVGEETLKQFNLQQSFHVTLTHKADKAQKSRFEQLEQLILRTTEHENFAQLAGGSGQLMLNNFKFSILLQRVIWDQRAIAVYVKIASCEPMIDYDTEKSYHVTLGVAQGTKPVYSNEIIQKFVTDPENLEISSAGWDREIIMDHLPFMGHI